MGLSRAGPEVFRDLKGSTRPRRHHHAGWAGKQNARAALIGREPQGSNPGKVKVVLDGTADDICGETRTSRILLGGAGDQRKASRN